LIHILRKMGLPNNTTNWLENYLQGATVHYKIDGYISEEFPIIHGVAQGCPMSPILSVAF
ncbi:hypothetical protein BOTBODRAFT_84895, partial [Botryobasidium botryosum FD-172 SS1]